MLGTTLAEDVGFEPTVPCSTTVFKTAAIDHSANLPIVANLGLEPRTLGYEPNMLPLHQLAI